MKARVAVASLIQETNTFSAVKTIYEDFQSQGIWVGPEVALQGAGMNIEIIGALNELESLGYQGVPIYRAWAMSGGIIETEAFDRLFNEMVQSFLKNQPIDAIILNLHGALVAEHEDYADALIVEKIRKIFGLTIPIVVTHDLHANVSRRITEVSNAVIGFHTYPHIDQADTGRRAARLIHQYLSGAVSMKTSLKKIRILIPAETQSTSDFPMKILRELGNSKVNENIADVSLFPVQPWLDVPELGFSVITTSLHNVEEAESVCQELIEELWSQYPNFNLDMFSIPEALAEIASTESIEPNILVQSSDSPTSGSTADDASVISALTNIESECQSISTLVDDPFVQKFIDADIGVTVTGSLGFSLDPRWGSPINIEAKLLNKGHNPIILHGPVMTGQSVSIGSWVLIKSSNGAHILVTQRPAPTFDPATYEQVGIAIEKMKIIHVRSALLFRSGYAGRFNNAYILNTVGPSTPNFVTLKYTKIAHPFLPFDSMPERIEVLVNE